MASVRPALPQADTISSIRRERRNNAALTGCVQTIRAMAGFAFALLRRFDGVVQLVVGDDLLAQAALTEGCCIKAQGEIVFDERAPHGFEMHAAQIDVLSRPAQPLPQQVGRYKLTMGLEAELSLRPVTLRSLRSRAVFKVQEGIVRGFSDFLFAQGFTQIHTPKINAAGAEGGANIFRLPYFGKDAVLAQSPQLYKQTMVGVYDRVFEVGPVFRAEKHATTRHLNEYTSLDLEMGYITDETDIMAMETALLHHVLAYLGEAYKEQLTLLKAELPVIDEEKGILAIAFTQAKEAVAARYGRRIRDPYDLEPEEEQLISRMVLEDTGSRFCFVTAYPSKKRPFYAMDDPAQPKFTKSFDLLLDGLEITTGGQRIHEYAMQLEKLQRRGMDPAEFESYLMIHKYGMPPHGGLGIGLERLTMKLLGLQNIRQASLFPRDITRLLP